MTEHERRSFINLLSAMHGHTPMYELPATDPDAPGAVPTKQAGGADTPAGLQRPTGGACDATTESD